MKSLHSILAIVVLCSWNSVQAQGTINFGSTFTGVFRAPVYNVDPANPTVAISGQSALGVPAGTVVYPGPLLSGSSYTAALWAGASPDSLQEVSMSAIAFRSTADPEVLPNGLFSTRTVTVSSVGPGMTAYFQIRAWDNRTGATYDSATVRGQSEIVQSSPLGGIGPNGPVLAPNTVGWSSFSLALVPEPSFLAFGAVVLGALVLRRRR